MKMITIKVCDEAAKRYDKKRQGLIENAIYIMPGHYNIKFYLNLHKSDIIENAIYIMSNITNGLLYATMW